MKHVVISLLNFNGKKNTLDCLDSLQNIKRDNFKLSVVVVDNASTDGSLEEIQNTKVKIIGNKENLGFAGGHNTAIKYALENGADYILILNNDTYVDKDFLVELLKVAEKDDDIGILTPKIYFAPGFEFHKDKYKKEELGRVIWYAGGVMDWKNIIGHHRGVDEVDKGKFDEIEETELATGCCMLIKKEVFEKVGLFDDKYFLYYEDADLTMRTKRKNFKIMYVPKSIIWHKNAGSAGGSGSELQDYYITRNRLIFGMRYAPARAKFALLKESLKILLNGRHWQRRGVLDFYIGKLGKGSFKV
ncbi:MAG: glycosyltransferase family 2 protein [bacterium]|nr:glycosyltransferase family 2 protein [bacterium]